MASSGLSNNQAAMAEADAIMKQDEKKGAVVHSFDPNTPPNEKAAQAGKGRDQLDSIIPPSMKNEQEGELKMEGDSSSPVVPTIIIEDLGNEENVVAKDTDQVAEEVQDEAANIPGAMPNKPAPTIPDWYKVGWRQMSGIDKPPLPEGEERDKGILDEFLSEQYYGSWYHNAGIIVFAVLASHFLARFNFGWGWLFIVLAFCNTYYTTSMDRVRRYARDDIQRELVKTRLASEHETADWINNFLDRFWLIYEPVLSSTVVQSVDQILSTNTPAFLDSLRLTHFTLGTKAPRIDKVRTFPKTEDDVVMMDWGISFTPKDTSDMTERQIADSVNPKITLSVRLGKGLATAALPILVEDISFSGLLRIRMKLIANFPHVQVVDITFLEKPVIGYVLKPIGGETFGFDIGSIPGLSSFIRDMTHATLGPMMYDPNVFSLNLEQMLSGKPLDAAIGVIQVNIQSARGITGTKIGGGDPDPFVSLTINDRAELARTKHKNNTYNPTWMETKYLLVHSMKDILTLSVYDFNDHRKNTLIGSTAFEFAKLLDDATQEGLVSPLLKEGKTRGELRYDVNYFPVVEPEEGKEELLESTVGIVRLVVHQAKELDHSKSLSGDLNPLAKVWVNNAKSASFSTPYFKHTNNPVWEAPYEFLCINKDTATITVKCIDDRDFLKDPVVGYMTIKLTDLIDAYGQAGKDWFPLSGCKSGKIRLSAEWKPLSMAGALQGSEQYKPPIGVVKLVIEKANDVKNVEATLGGKSDPYVRVQLRNVTKGRTEVINNNLNPVWNQIIYIPVHNLKETLMLECMDYQHLTRDRSLGSVELHLSDLAVEAPEDHQYPYKSNGVIAAQDHIRLDKNNSFKGTLFYSAEFVPTLNVKFDKFESTSEASQLAGQSDDGGYMSSASERSVDDGPISITITSPFTPNTPASPTTSSHKKTDSNGKTSLRSAKSNKTTGSGRDTPEKEDTSIQLTQDELLSHQSGIIIFNIVSGHLHKKARLEILLDDGYWPCFSTLKARGTHAQWSYVGEGFMKEVDFGQVWLRLNEADENEKDDIIGQWKGDVKSFLQATMNGPHTFSIPSIDGGDKISTVLIESRYIPVPVTLEAREKADNQGILRISLISGHEIRGVDRGGKSDPYVVFTLNGEKVYKSQTKKKTLTPEWNESFEVSVPSRATDDFSLEVFDWNQIEQAKSLGIGKIDLINIEPFQSEERNINLLSQKHGDKGQIHIQLMFQPEIIAKSRKNTSTFSTAGRAMTTIGGLPVTAGKGVFHGVTGVFKRGDKDQEEVVALPNDLLAGQTSQPVGVSDHMQATTATFPSSENGHGTVSHEPGTLRVTVLDAKDLSVSDGKPYATLRLGDKEVKTKHTGKTGNPEWNESFVFAASTLTPKVFVWIYDHKTLGKDKEIAEGEVDIWRHIKPEGVSAADVFVELRQGGLLRLRLEFDASSHLAISSRTSIHSGERTQSLVSPSRFSIHRRRGNANDSDES